MSLEYLNGIGGPRRQAKKAAKKSGSVSKKGGRHKGALKRIVKAAPKNPVAAARMAKKVIRKSSPLNAIRIKKALTQERQRAIFEQGEPMTTDEMDINQSGGGEESEGAFADENTGADSEEMDYITNEEADNTGADDMNDAMEEEIGCIDMGGLLYPAEIGGKQRKAKKAAKTSNKQAKGDSKKLKAQAKLEKAKQGSGKFSALVNKGLDTAGKYLDKGKNAASAVEKDEAPAKGNFLEENKGLLIGGGLGLAALIFLPKLIKG